MTMSIEDAYQEVCHTNDCEELDKNGVYEALCLAGHNPIFQEIGTFWEKKRKSDFETINLDELIELEASLEDPKKAMEEAFAVFDKNNDGKIDKEELRRILKQSDVPGSEMYSYDDGMVEAIFAKADKNGDGFLDKNELIMMITEGQVSSSY
ncbi:troponin C, skeletal muscle-like [Dreissena polymorpha]|uniref:EF-hand domain-containing protein n=1 Tax=Dreissena polymorpha TaxID=45954 RepID=A0A9D4JU35_DREPO|nr:troponin C, skeletal muscle-like [Dreissena polymorpha]XP_052275382.1 troponin C, skeletal muscle-like [Dreissena polymorpha]KAH3822964.1 hypothetical protein DPMN_124758 [Dreissena polymorpha]